MTIWREGGPLTAWTDHDGPAPPASHPSPWPRINAAGWLVLGLPIAIIGCSITCTPSHCPLTPTWAQIMGDFLSVTFIAVLVGGFMRKAWSLPVGVLSAGLGLAGSSTDLKAAPAWALFELGSFALLLVLGLVSTIAAFRRRGSAPEVASSPLAEDVLTERSNVIRL